jgi:glycosidase
VNQDLYASEKDKERMTQGWFVPDMPDLNQQNPFMAKYLIQNSIWWIETLDLGGIRQDTYPYSDKDFMAKWAGTIMNEYPYFSIVGEEWSYNPLLVGYWQEGAQNKDGYRSNLGSTMDFPMLKAIIEGLNDEESWDNGLIRMYEGLANDFYYAHPEKIVAFLDNHDKSRIYTEFKKDLNLTKMGLSYLLVLPRIPQIYYGTEILMDDSKNPGDHGLIRSDFPGGWKNDKVNAFTGKGLSKKQKEIQDFLKRILNYRKHSLAISKGKTLHFAPEDGIYIIFRIYQDETVVLILNKNKKPVNLNLKRFDETGLYQKKLKNILTDEIMTWKKSIKLRSKGCYLFTTKLRD